MMYDVVLHGKPGPKVRSLKERFDAKWVEDESGCWLWTASITKSGYGVFTHHAGLGKRGYGKQQRAHRLAWELYRGPFPEGLQVDHLCRVRHCVNPDHLEPVTARENQLRSNSVSGHFAKQTHCVNGHEFTDANTYRHGPDKRWRMCRACVNARMRKRRAEGGG